MKILLVAATPAELAPILQQFNTTGNLPVFKNGDTSTEVLITGAGMVATAFTLGKQLTANQYDLAINTGITGSFDFDLAIGEVVLVTEDIFAEQGAEDGDDFLSLKELGLGDSFYAATATIPQQLTANLRQVKAITVNKVHGNELSIANTIARFNPQVESMEGAAFFYACKQMAVPAMQIRAISNYVERRNKEKWNIGLATTNLNQFIGQFLNQLNNPPGE